MRRPADYCIRIRKAGTLDGEMIPYCITLRTCPTLHVSVYLTLFYVRVRLVVMCFISWLGLLLDEKRLGRQGLTPNPLDYCMYGCLLYLNSTVPS